MKKCRTCKEEKPLDSFYNQKNAEDGKMNQCKICNKEGVKQRYLKNRKTRLEYNKKWVQENKEYIKKYRKENLPRANELRKNKYKNNVDYRSKVKQKVKEYRENPKNKSIITKSKRISLRIYRQRPEIKILMNLRRRMSFVLDGKRKADHSINLIGCTREQLKLHLEKQFRPGMSWDNYGSGKGKWCIDHIKPCKDFDLSTPEQQKLCFHYLNLQPLWFEENAAKDHPYSITSSTVNSVSISG